MINIPSESMLSVIQKRIQDKIPVSVVRLGDGEAMVLNKYRDEEKFKLVVKRQFGSLDFTIQQFDDLHANLVEAYRGADIIGIPTQRHLTLNYFWREAFNLMVEKVGYCAISGKEFTSIDFHSHWLDTNAFDELLTGADNMCYISCRNLDQQFKERFNIKNVWSYIIAPEMKFTSGYKGKKHFPDQFKEIQKWVTKVPVENAICLVGAGVAGKIYCNWFRDLKGYAIDIGSCFDSFYGKATRGAKRGLDAVDETYKL